MRIDIAINYHDRPTELGLLLESLRHQTHQEFDVHILDDESRTPIFSYYFISKIIKRLRHEGHNVLLHRNNKSRGVALGRQLLIDYILKDGVGEAICRLDDDVIIEPDYLERLVKVLKSGYDIASGVTPNHENPRFDRSINYVSPVINRVVFDEEGRFVINADDCGHTYIEEAILPADHFRSCALIKREVHEKVSYEDNLTKCGMREEEFFSFRSILAGFSIGVDVQAIAWHLRAPSGGDRRNDYNQLAVQNQLLLNRFTQRKFKECGDFIEQYHRRLKIKDLHEDKFRTLNKDTNFIMHREL